MSLSDEARRKCQVSFMHYVAAMKPQFVFSHFSRSVCNDLQRFYVQTQKQEMPNLLLEAPPQHGKQIADHTPVLTTHGWKTHGELVIGDCVFHPSGHAIQVLAISKKTPSHMRVTLSNGDVIWCHKNHEWTVTSHDWKSYKTLETREMLQNGLWKGERGKRGSRARFQLPLCESLYGKHVKLPVEPYVLGAWLGDGSQTKPCITYDEKDSIIVDEIEKCGYQKTTTCIHKNTGVFTSYFDPQLKKDLKNASVFADKAKMRNKHIPDIYLTASIDQRLRLLAGLIDTDGYVYQKNGRTVFTTADVKLANSFCSLLSTFGWSYSFVIEQPKLSSSGIQGKKEYYVIGFNPTLFIPCLLPRKQNKKLLVKRRHVSIIDISFKKDSLYQGNCITVNSPDGLYLVGKTLQPTHNSWLCAELFPSWCLGINPNIRMGVSTYTSPLAEKRNIEIQRLIESARYQEIFPNTKLRQGNNIIEGARNSQEFEVIGHDGSLRAVGVGGSLTGFPLDIGVIDDPYKDMAAARSPTQNSAVIEWYNSVFRTRMSKQSGVVMMLTRWAKNDLAGWAVENEQWTERKYRAIEESKALVPFLHPIEQLERIKASLPEAIWQALYQQNPIIQGGNIIKDEWFQYYAMLPQAWDRIFLVADTAQKTKEHNDYSVISAFGVSDKGLYLLDMWRDKVTAPGLREAANRMWNKWHSGIGEKPCSGFYIEDKSSGTGLIQDLAAGSAIPIIPLQRTTDKYTRLMDVLNYIQSGRLYLPVNAPWVRDATEEMLAFSGDMKHEHDDIVDTIIDGLFIAFGPGMLSILDVI